MKSRTPFKEAPEEAFPATAADARFGSVLEASSPAAGPGAILLKIQISIRRTPQGKHEYEPTGIIRGKTLPPPWDSILPI